MSFCTSVPAQCHSPNSQVHFQIEGAFKNVCLTFNFLSDFFYFLDKMCFQRASSFKGVCLKMVPLSFGSDIRFHMLSADTKLGQ